MRTHSRSKTRVFALAALPLAGVLALTGCGAADAGEPAANNPKRVSIVVHDSFVDGDAFAAAASKATGFDVEVLTAGDGGELANKLVLTKGAPIADAFFGIDNTFASRLIDNDVVEPVAVDALPERAVKIAAELDGATAEQVPLVPIDIGATCVNIDSDWFAEHGVAEPATFDDLADPQYKDLAVLLDPTGSSTGASFMIATIAKFGEDGFVDYWKSLEANGARIVQGWTEAYNTEFSGVNEAGSRPIVVSYSTSPAFTVNDDETASNTRALLDTCSSQTEFAGVLKGSANPEGALAVVNYLLSEEFQSGIADQMYMYPVDESIELPSSWAKFAPLPADGQAHDLSSAEIQAGLDGWLRTLGDAVGL
ncbi:thiamine ABC transporter substrate binding subunit [Leucobacter albus]|uniref:Thiamine ABC transporter substrate binding subunit n=1 Tax=Leucobacter albus TaxID=272210 RepID=A0ABW3TQ67_9MICO